jgi:hypothetical protein
VQRAGRKQRGSRVFGFGEVGSEVVGRPTRSRLPDHGPGSSSGGIPTSETIQSMVDERVAAQVEVIRAEEREQLRKVQADLAQMKAAMDQMMRMQAQPQPTYQSPPAGYYQPYGMPTPFTTSVPYYVSTDHLRTQAATSSDTQPAVSSAPSRTAGEDFFDTLLGTPPS